MNKVELAAIVQFIVIIALSIHLTNLNSHKRDLETKEAEINGGKMHPLQFSKIEIIYFVYSGYFPAHSTNPFLLIHVPDILSFNLLRVKEQI